VGDLLLTIITDNQDQKILPQDKFLVDERTLSYRLPGFTSKSPELIFEEFTTPMGVTAGQEYRIWYGEDLTDANENDNGERTACVDVFMYGLFG
jgi:hypothetical protein